MCLIVFAWQVIPGIPLIAAANRDEYYARATAPASAWPEHPQIYAGRDLKAGGSWMGISQSETGTASPRFAAITNIRAPAEHRDDAPSRGHLVADYLAGSMSAQEYVDTIRAGIDAYNGFNLVLGDRDTLIWFSNKAQHDPRNGQPLEPGIYGLSNALLDAPWPKVLKTKAQFASLLCWARRKTPISRCWPIPRPPPTSACRTPACRWTWSACCPRCASRRPATAPAPPPSSSCTTRPRPCCTSC